MGDELDRGADEDFSDIESGDSAYVGVPFDYKARRDTGRQRVTSHEGHYGYSTIRTEPERREYAPRYRKGDEYKAPRGFAPERVAPYQDELVAAGLLTGEFSYGTWDDKTVAAWKKVLAYANRAGVSSRDALEEFKRRPIPAKKSGSARLPLTVELENPSDIRSAIRSQVPEILGHTLSPAEAEQLVALYHQLQRQAQTAAYNSASSVVRPPDLTSFVQEQAKKMHPEDADQYALIQQGKVLYSLIGDFAGGKEF